MQLNFEGKDRVQVAIDRIREFEPPEGYYLAFSGGKDSVVLYDLAVKSGVKFDAHYSLTGIDPPELVQFIRTHYPTVQWDRPQASMWTLIAKHAGLPTRDRRWCCALLKECHGRGRRLLTGIRWAESSRRRQRRLIEVCYTDSTKVYVHPIIDWPTSEVWDYIKENQIPYCSLYDEGWKRLGCVLCPMASARITKAQIVRWPKLAAAWRRATDRLYTSVDMRENKKIKTADELWEWWISRKSLPSGPESYTMFE